MACARLQTIPPQPYTTLTNHQGHDLHIGINGLVLAVLLSR